MKKLRLSLEDISVATFATENIPAPKGTVAGHGFSDTTCQERYCTCDTVWDNTCQWTCEATCQYSCQCPPSAQGSCQCPPTGSPTCAWTCASCDVTCDCSEPGMRICV